MNILITGAAGNLGSHTVKHLLASSHQLFVLQHKRELPGDLANCSRLTFRRADLAQPETLEPLCAGVDCIIHLAGVLFAPQPEKFLPKTNVGYVANLLRAALSTGVKKFILISFPHAEGESTPEHPALGKLDADPKVIHFRTRLEAERHLITTVAGTQIVPVIFRAGIVYGKHIKLFKAARWMLSHNLMAIWNKPTWAHLLALPDFLTALQTAIESQTVSGIYQVCDDCPLLLQDLMDKLADHWNYRHPVRLPGWAFHAAGILCETAALICRTSAPLNRDLVNAGMTSCVADNSRMKRELLPRLAYPTIHEGLTLL